MERNKREAKPPEPYIIPPICYPRIRKKKPKKKAPEKARYQMIPYPLKFIYTQKIFCLYAVSSPSIPLFPSLFLPFSKSLQGIGLREYQGTLYTESSVLNEYIMYTGIDVKAEKNYKLFSVSIETKEEFKLPPW